MKTNDQDRSSAPEEKYVTEYIHGREVRMHEEDHREYLDHLAERELWDTFIESLVGEPMTPDYLAVVLIGGGSSWGRAPDKEAAIQRAMKALKDWTIYFDLSNTEVEINVIDVAGYSDCNWGGNPGGWLHGTNIKTGQDEAIKRPIEIVKRRTPRWRIKRRGHR